MDEVFVEENGVKIKLDKDHDNPTRCQTFYNPEMRIGREFALACFKAFCNQPRNVSTTLQCLDAFGASGISGLQWAVHSEDTVQITINELDESSVKAILSNCALNGIECSSQGQKYEPLEIPGPSRHEECENHSGQNVEVIRADANILLNSRQFHCIYLDPFGTTVHFLDATFRNVYNGGVVILTSTDVSSLYGQCPNVLLRNYNAYNTRCQYTKEIAARIVLAAAASSAARCNKGLEVLYCLAVNHFVQVAVRIKRGAKCADESCANIRRMIHCANCQDWALYPPDNAISADVRQLLPCRCFLDLGNCTVMLGPLWMGNIFNLEFISLMEKEANGLELSKCSQLLNIMKDEAMCVSVTGEKLTSEIIQHVQDSEPNDDRASCQCPVTECSSGNGAMRPLLADNDAVASFYFSLGKMKIGNMNIPRLQAVLEALRAEGFRASRTHFEPQSVRSNTTRTELKHVLIKYFAQPVEKVS